MLDNARYVLGVELYTLQKDAEYLASGICEHGPIWT